jgi:plasmid stabilization system protein ParE
MTYRVVITTRAQRDIDAFARYCRSYSPAFWREQSDRLSRVFETWLSKTPGMWASSLQRARHIEPTSSTSESVRNFGSFTR